MIKKQKEQRLYYISSFNFVPEAVQEFTSLDEVFSNFSHTVSIRFNQGHSTRI